MDYYGRSSHLRSQVVEVLGGGAFGWMKPQFSDGKPSHLRGHRCPRTVSCAKAPSLNTGETGDQRKALFRNWVLTLSPHPAKSCPVDSTNRPYWVRSIPGRTRESKLNRWQHLNCTVNEGTQITESQGPQQKKRQQERPQFPPELLPTKRTDIHQAPETAKPRLYLDLLTPWAFCRQVWFSLSTDSVIKSGPLLSLRQAVRLDANLFGWERLSDSSLLVEFLLSVFLVRKEPAPLSSVILPSHVLRSPPQFGGLLKKPALAETYEPSLLLLTRAGCTAVKSKSINSPFEWHVEVKGESLWPLQSPPGASGSSYTVEWVGR